MKRDIADALTAAEAATAKAYTSPPTAPGDPAHHLAEMLGYTDPPNERVPQWHHYSAEAIAFAANDAIERLEADIEEAVQEGRAVTDGDKEHPAWLDTAGARRRWRDQLATRIATLGTVVDLLRGVRGDAAREIPREAEPHPDPEHLPDVFNMSAVELIGLGLMKHLHPRTDSERITNP